MFSFCPEDGFPHRPVISPVPQNEGLSDEKKPNENLRTVIQ